jgi:glutamate dehydrogenase
VLLAYAKNSAIEMLSGVEVYDMFDKEPYREIYLNYFPKLLRDNSQYRKYLLNHRLAKEILVTALVNDLINTMGCTYFHLMVVRQGVSPIKLIKAFCLIKYGLQVDRTINMVENALLHSDQTLKLHRLLQTMIGRNIGWILHGQLDEIDANTQLYGNMHSSINNLISLVSSNNISKSDLIKDILKVENPSKELKEIASIISGQWFATDIFFASQKSGIEIFAIAKSYELLRHKLQFDIINSNVASVFYGLNYESKIAIMIVMRSLDSLLMKLCVAFIQWLGGSGVNESDLEKLNDVCANNSLGKYLDFINEINNWSEQDVVSLLLLIKNRMKAILNSIRHFQK